VFAKAKVLSFSKSQYAGFVYWAGVPGLRVSKSRMGLSISVY
jgi:hypothetical protein